MELTVLGVPSSAGAYCVGVEEAPAALRGAGLLRRLSEAGHDVHDAGDLTVRRWRPDRAHPLAQNVDDEAAGLAELSEAAAVLLADERRLLVLGGSCTVAVGVCSALARVGTPPRLLYVDRHLDLHTPESTTEGSFSWMGVAHCLAVEGAAPEILAAAGPAPLLGPGDVVYLGIQTDILSDLELERLGSLGLAVVPQADLVERPGDAARSARSALPDGPFAVHLDVDVLDFLDAPIAENVNGRGSGPTLEQLAPALATLWQDPDCRVLSVGQLLPAHAASDPGVLDRFVDVLVTAAGAP